MSRANDSKLPQEPSLYEQVMATLREHDINEENLDDHLKRRFGSEYIWSRALNQRKTMKRENDSKANQEEDDESAELGSQSQYDSMNKSYLLLSRMDEINFRNQVLDAKSEEFDIFLSHSFRDRLIIYGLYLILTDQCHYRVYIDWIVDPYLSVNRDKAALRNIRLIRLRMKSSKHLVLVKTTNYHGSKWIAWEVGYHDGFNQNTYLLPLNEDSDYDSKGVSFLRAYLNVQMAFPKLVAKTKRRDIIL